MSTDDNQKLPFLGVFIGDSLSMARYPIGLQFEDTYSYLLEMFWRKLYPTACAWSLMLPGMPLKQMSAAFYSRFLQYIGPRKIDTCVIQCGIVDCAPRVLPLIMQAALDYFPTVPRNLVVRFLHNNRPRLQKAGWSFRNTPPDKFNKIFSDLVQTLSLQCSRIYVISIAPGIESVYAHSPGLRESIVRYNEIIRTIVSKYVNTKLIDIVSEFGGDPIRYMTDDLHITKSGHRYIYSRIRELELAAISGADNRRSEDLRYCPDV